MKFTLAHPLQISCVSSNWRGLVIGALTKVREIDLVHFLFKSDDEFCQEIAAKYLMNYTAHSKQRTASFRKPPRHRG